MDELKQLDRNTLSSNNESDGDQHYDEDHDNVNMEDPQHVEGVPAGDPSAIQNNRSTATKTQQDLTTQHSIRIMQISYNNF